MVKLGVLLIEGGLIKRLCKDWKPIVFTSYEKNKFHKKNILQKNPGLIENSNGSAMFHWNEISQSLQYYYIKMILLLVRNDGTSEV
jgi:hypothetical protein